MSQQELAFATGMATNVISRIENGRSNVGLDTIKRLATALHCTMAELMPDYPGIGRGNSLDNSRENSASNE